MNRNQVICLHMVSAIAFFIVRHLISMERSTIQSHFHQLRQRLQNIDSILQTSIPLNDLESSRARDDSETGDTREFNFFFGGNKAFYYKYEPVLLPLPASVSLQNAHGIHVSYDCSEQDLECGPTIIITYQDKVDDSKCLLQWKAGEYDKPAKFLGPGTSLCGGVPHGLTAMKEADTSKDGEDSTTATTYLYHANNDQHLSKTTPDGKVVWTHQYQPPVPRDTNSTEPEFKPTWFAGQPNSPYVYLADGYGTSRIYQYYKSNGTYAGRYFGGSGTDDGFFQTSHGMSWDDRGDDGGHMIVCDRENHRLSYFAIDPKQPEKFEYLGQQRMESYSLYRPCNIRYHPTTKQAIIPFLEGSVGIFYPPNPDEPLVQPLEVILNITDQMGKLGFLHPHDAHFLPNGDFVLVTWAPGRIGYFRKMEEAKEKKSTSLHDRDPFGEAARSKQ